MSLQELPWRTDKRPWFNLNLSWSWIFMLIIVSIVIIIVIWLFTGGKSHRFVGIPNFDANRRPSDILDSDTMEFLQINDSSFPYGECEVPSGNGYAVPSRDPYQAQLGTGRRNFHQAFVPSHFRSLHRNSTDRTDLNSIDPNNHSQTVTPIIPRTRTNSNFTSSTRDDTDSERNGGYNLLMSNRYSSSQPATVVLTSGEVETYNHIIPHIASNESDLNSDEDNGDDGNLVDMMIDITPRNSSKDLSPLISMNSDAMRPTNSTPRYDQLDIGTFEERRSAAESRGERICREFMERHYGRPFKRIRPDFLRNPLTDRNLELDGYNQELGIAFEYNGVQHYRYPNYFHTSEEQFWQQFRRDNYKRDACQEAGIYLINIPYTIPHFRIPDFLREQLPHNRL